MTNDSSNGVIRPYLDAATSFDDALLADSTITYLGSLLVLLRVASNLICHLSNLLWRVFLIAFLKVCKLDKARICHVPKPTSFRQRVMLVCEAGIYGWHFFGSPVLEER